MSGATTVLVVDDEPQILRALRVVLRQAGYRVDTAASREEALDALALRVPDALVLDLVLPDGSGIDVCRELRRFSAVPVIVLSAVGDDRQKVQALDEGADDYVTKPFSPEELLARLRAVLRRTREGPDGTPLVRSGDLEIDLEDRRVRRGGEHVHLTPREFEILAVLARHQGKLVTHRQLLTEVWGPQYATETHYLRVHVSHLRRKVEPDPSRPRHVVTEPGVGFRLLDPGGRDPGG